MNPYLIGIAALALVSAGFGLFKWGQETCRSEAAENTANRLIHEGEKYLDADKEHKAVEEKVKVIFRTIEKTHDPKDCLDAPTPVDFDHGMRDIAKSIKR
jgi:hypothetical protein